MVVPNIKQLRESRGMTQEQLGLLIGMGKSQISRMEHGTLGSIETYSRVLQALGYRPEVRYVDERPGNNLNRDSVLSLLKVYYLYNNSVLGIEKMGLFGSFARDEANEESDIDILISLHKPSLLKYSSISRQLEYIFGRKVDLVSETAIHTDEFAKQLSKDVIYVSE